MSMTVTVVVTVSDSKFPKSKHATATSGQSASLHVVGEATVAAVKAALGSNAVTDSDVQLTSVTVA